MLKKICGLFLGLVVCAGSACVTPTHASSAPEVIITNIQAAGTFGAKDEYVVLHNNSAVEVDITDWCLVNKSSVSFACFISTSTDATERYYLPPYGDAILASVDHVTTNGYPDDTYTIIYEVTNQSSGSIVNSSDIIYLVNKDGEVFDTKAWSTAIPTNKVLTRVRVMVGPDIYANTNSLSDWSIENRVSLPVNSVEKRVVISDPDPVLEPNPETESPTNSNTVLDPVITELLANPAGSDIGNEFIELYNPNEHDFILLDEFSLLIGIDPVKLYAFAGGTTIPPLGYIVFTNQQINYTLGNTNSKVQLAKAGVAVGTAVEYSSPKDDYVWALVDESWTYTKQATPNAPNTLTLSEEVDEAEESDTAKPCASNQFRNPETGRCKLLSAALSSSSPCKQNQERNPETNRCRNVVAASSPAPCKEGQERNLETNRCRAIVKMSKAPNAVSAQTKADAAMSWYYWAAMGAVVLLVLGYGVWEWRQELANLWTRLRIPFAKHTD